MNPPRERPSPSPPPPPSPGGRRGSATASRPGVPRAQPPFEARAGGGSVRAPAACWWARTIVESTETSQSMSPAASASAWTSWSRRSHVPSARVRRPEPAARGVPGHPHTAEAVGDGPPALGEAGEPPQPLTRRGPVHGKQRRSGWSPARTPPPCGRGWTKAHVRFPQITSSGAPPPRARDRPSPSPPPCCSAMALFPSGACWSVRGSPQSGSGLRRQFQKPVPAAGVRSYCWGHADQPTGAIRSGLGFDRGDREHGRGHRGRALLELSNRDGDFAAGIREFNLIAPGADVNRATATGYKGNAVGKIDGNVTFDQ